MSAGLMLAMAMHPGTHPFNTRPYTGGVAYTPPPPPPPSTSPVPSPAYSPRKDPKLAWPWGRAVSGYEDASPTLGPSHHLSPTPPPPQQRVHSAPSTPLKEQDLSDFFAKYDLLSTGGAPGKPRGDAGMKGMVLEGVVPEKNQHEVDAPDWGAEPGDAASGRRPTRSTSRSGGSGAARSGGSAGSSSGGGRGSTPARRTRGRGAAGGGGGGDDDEGDGDDAEKGRGKDRLDIVEISSGEESEEEEQSSDDPLDLVTPAKTQERPKGKGKAVSFAVGPAPPGKAEGAAPAAKRSRKDTDDDEPAQRYFGPKKDRAGPFPPPSRRPGDEPPVPAQDRIAPWGETWWADRAPVFDFGETVFAQAYQSVQITADLARGKDGKRPQMADPESLPWTSRFGLPAPEDMPMMAAREKEFERDGVWDLQKALPILFDKDGSERTVEEVFPTYPDCNPQSNWKGKGRAQGRT